MTAQMTAHATGQSLAGQQGGGYETRGHGAILNNK
jgi:hypothetical protein